MKIFLVFISALALGMGSAQYYIQYHIPAPAVLAIETQAPEPTVTPALSPTATSTPTSTPEPTLTLTPKPTPINTPRPTLVPTIAVTPTATVTINPTATLTPTSAPVATVTISYSLVLAPPSMEPVFAEMAEKYHVDANLLKKIASCESHFNPGVVSPNSQYAGMFQFTTGTWQSNRTAMGMDTNPDLRFGIRESIETAAFMISRGSASSTWPACSR